MTNPDITAYASSLARENEELREKNEKLVADAARYRWLRDEEACSNASIGVYQAPWANNREWLVGDALDAAIDEALAGAKP
jgi:hypothetical protein